MKLYFSFFLLLLGFCSCLQKVDDQDQSVNLFYQSAIRFRDEGKADSAFLYFNRAKDVYQQQGDQFSVGKCLVNMGILSTEQGDYFGGQELSLSALSYFSPKNVAHHVYLRSNFNNLGITSFKLKDYRQAVDFYRKSLDFIRDSASKWVVMNNMASAYREAKDYAAALATYRYVLEKNSDPSTQAMALAGHALTQWLRNPSYDPLPEFREALNMRIQHNNKWGQNASYAFFADYYMKQQPDSALFYATKMYRVANLLNSPDDRLIALQKLVKLSGPAETKSYFSEYQRLADSLQTQRSAAKNQFALIRYETEKYKADKLRLQKENTVRNIWIVSLIVFITGGSIFTVIWYRKRKERLRQESLHAIRESRFKTSKKVHDVVANGLYRLISEIDNSIRVDVGKILDILTLLYDQSRNIAHEEDIADMTGAQFAEKISEMLQAFKTPEIQLFIIGNTAGFWENIDANKREELKNILQELMVNMRKHSGANQVAFRFENSSTTCRIHYLDNGIGISDEKNKGSGLRNTENRMSHIKGSVTFAQATGGGLKVTLSFPTC